VPGYLDNVFVPLAIDLIAQFGTPAVLRRRTSVHNATTGTVTDTDTDYNVLISPPTPCNEKRMKGASYQVGDSTCMVAAGDLAIQPNSQSDLVIHQGTTWEIVHVDTKWSGQERCAYLMYLRK
jgi:hypothetical protein